MSDLSIGEMLFDTTSSQNLASGALSLQSAFSTDFEFSFISLHLTVATTQTVTISLVDTGNANFTTIIYSDSIKSLTDFVYQAPARLVLKKGMELKVQLTNSGTPASTVYAKICGYQA